MQDSFRFLRAIIRDRRSVGAIAPSGRHLANVVVRSLGQVPPGSIIVELGPGTGSFTRMLSLRHPQCTIIAIEVDHLLVNTLRRTLPRVRVVHGCASQIGAHIEQLGLDRSKVAGVVSGLPLLTLPKGLPTAILEEIAEVLPEGKPYVQFTYSRIAWRRFTPRRLRFHRAQLVMSNIPPASVLSFHKADALLAPSSIKPKRSKNIFKSLRRRRKTTNV